MTPLEKGAGQVRGGLRGVGRNIGLRPETWAVVRDMS
jgi:hypothetical protein